MGVASGEVHTSRQHHLFRPGLHAVERQGLFRSHLFNAFQSGEEIVMPPAAPELTIRHCAQAALLFLFHQSPYGVVFHSAQFLRGNQALLRLQSGLPDGLRAQEAADVICAEGRDIAGNGIIRNSHCHISFGQMIQIRQALTFRAAATMFSREG